MCLSVTLHYIACLVYNFVSLKFHNMELPVVTYTQALLKAELNCLELYLWQTGIAMIAVPSAIMWDSPCIECRIETFK